MSTLKVNSIEGATGGEVDINATLGTIPAIVISGVTTVSAGTTSAPAITPSGDSNTGIFFPSADTIAFAEGGVEAARFDSSGRLGIGIANPSSTLHVSGNQIISGSLALGRTNVQSGFFVDGSTAGDYGLIFRDSSDADRGIFIKSGTAATGVSLVGTNTANRHLGFAPGDTEKVRITSTGNVGIGTNNPTQKLQINDFSATTVTPLVLRNYATGSGNTKVRIALQGITASGQGAVATIQSIAGTDAGGSNANNDSGLQFIVTNSGAGTENIAMTVNTNGRVSIGMTTAPTSGDPGSAKLTVAGSGTGDAYLNITRNLTSTSIANNSPIGSIFFTESSGGTYAQIQAVCDGTSSSTSDLPGRLVFYTTADGASTPTERMRIGQNGSVQIGRTVGQIETELLTLQNSGQCGWIYQTANSNVEALTIRHTYAQSAQTAKMIRFSQNNGAEVGSITSTTTATAYGTSSDYRLKENVAAITDGIGRLQQLKPSRFNFIIDPDKTVDGFIAHEVQTVVPEAVIGTKDEVDADGNPVYQGIDQSKLVPLLTAALQEAIAKIETLEAKVAALEAQ